MCQSHCMLALYPSQNPCCFGSMTDDLGAIIIIAAFYSHDLSIPALLVVFICILVLFLLNHRNITEVIPYIMVGVVMWCALLKSGVHATLAGVILAFFIPLRNKKKPERSPLRELEHDLHKAVAFGILPLFAFTNSGILVSRDSFEFLLHPIPMGIAAGLFIGKQAGVFAFCWVSVKIGIAKLPGDMSWRSLYGVALLCGVGFTMSLFIGSLAFENTGINLLFDERLGIITGSLLSGIAGYFFLRASLANDKKLLTCADRTGNTFNTIHAGERTASVPLKEQGEERENVEGFEKDIISWNIVSSRYI
ncbi:MAG: Na+/H+ antiporter NhaA [Candidatus Brocadiaceae bacterium]|nr:Na+/H+ antiporter NhaA [Candidatus Brocadiaceae bacterium]